MKYLFSAIFTKENVGYSAFCPELGVASQGKTLDEAEKNIREAVELYIDDMPKAELEPYTHAVAEKPLLKTFEVVHA
jgi:predicted RNase H-like HicB family nuclease